MIRFVRIIRRSCPGSAADSLKEIEPSEFSITSEDTAAGAGAVVPLAAAAPVLPAVPLVVVEAPELVSGAVVAAMLAGAAGAENPVPAVVAAALAGAAVVVSVASAPAVAAGASASVSLVAAGLPVSSALTLKGVAAITPVTASAAT